MKKKELPPIGARIQFRMAHFQEYHLAGVTGHSEDGEVFYVRVPGNKWDTTVGVDGDWKYDNYEN